MTGLRIRYSAIFDCNNLSCKETTITYPLLRALLFRLDPEAAHHLSLEALKAAQRLHLLGGRRPSAPRMVMGISFPNPVGLAAGLDKDGEYIDALAALGFGFIEVGTVTPRPQPGNPKPRLFRLPGARAIINRMGFNNRGVDNLLANVQRARNSGVLGINIGKNFDTPVERAVDDYLIGLRKVYAHAAYVAVNISSPNTPNLRQLQQHDALLALLGELKAEQGRLAQQHGKYVPLAVKIAPDLSPEAVADIAALIRNQGIDAVIATNTTLAREGVSHLAHGDEAGGLSGAPLTQRSTDVVRQLHAVLGDEVPIIAVGGVMDAADAVAKVRAGASLVQLYSGFIYRGPCLIRETAEALRRLDAGTDV
jgi:dihydroorotate dehydrogenase